MPIHETDNSLLTNFDRNGNEEYIYLQAGLNTGFPVYIKDEAYSARDHLLPEYKSLHTKWQGKDHSIFWDEVRRLEKEK